MEYDPDELHAEIDLYNAVCDVARSYKLADDTADAEAMDVLALFRDHGRRRNITASHLLTLFTQHVREQMGGNEGA